LIHLHHAQYDWAWQAADTCLGGQPVIVSTITHGRPPVSKLETVITRATHLVCYSRSEAAYYAGLFPRMADHISVVPMGVNPALFSSNGHVEPEASVFMAGKINDYKNQLSVLEACKRLELPVRFAGFNEDAIHDPYTDEFARAVAAYPKAEMLGFLRGEALRDEYRRAHVHINASRFEPFGQVTLDGLAVGCNVVHSRESWSAEQFGRVGSLCDPGDVESIMVAIDTEMKRRRGWANVRPPTHIEAAKGLMAVYEKAITR
jgi:glycosyltransferase involved in cell wall biosynthesis